MFSVIYKNYILTFMIKKKLMNLKLFKKHQKNLFKKNGKKRKC